MISMHWAPTVPTEAAFQLVRGALHRPQLDRPDQDAAELATDKDTPCPARNILATPPSAAVMLLITLKAGLDAIAISTAWPSGPQQGCCSQCLASTPSPCLHTSMRKALMLANRAERTITQNKAMASSPACSSSTAVRRYAWPVRASRPHPTRQLDQRKTAVAYALAHLWAAECPSPR